MMEYSSLLIQKTYIWVRVYADCIFVSDTLPNPYKEEDINMSKY